MEDLHLVYTPMKVGSKTIATAIRTSDLGGKVAHFHFLSDWGLNWLEEKIRNDQRADVWIKQLDESVRLRAVLAARESLAAHGRTVSLAPRKPFIVTAIREPLGLHFSLMFETSWLFVPGALDFTPEILRNSFSTVRWHEWTDQWFDRELRASIGLDLFAERFPTDRGWQIYENDRALLLLIRTENMSDLGNALGVLYGHPFQMPSVELRASK
jgi:hypothetical protein